MFIIIYSFKTKDKQEQEFIEAWKEMTNLIYQYEGSLGSRLHLKKPGHYIAYAQWSDKSTWKNSGDNLPEKASEIRLKMHTACNEIETLYELEVVEDLLK